MHRNSALGRYGEALAERFLTRQGWHTLDRNWRCSAGELDLVAGKDGIIVVCEVKTRRSARYGSPLEAVTPEKLQRLQRLAELWLAAHPEHTATVRIDAITVLVDDAGLARLQHIEGLGQ